MWVTVVLILSMVGCSGENDQGIHETETPELVAVEVDTEDNGENMTENNEVVPGPGKAGEGAAGPQAPDRPSMVRVEGGEFLLDYVQIEPRPVWVDEFEIAIYKVTIGEWWEFLRQVPEVVAWNPPQ